MIGKEKPKRVKALPPAVILWGLLVFCSRMDAAYSPRFSGPGGPPPRDYRPISVRLEREIRTNTVTATLEALGAVPERLGVVIDDDLAKATWGPFTNSVTLNFGPGDGTHRVSFGYWWNANDIQWHTHKVRVITKPPTVILTHPGTNFTSQPLIQLKGYSTEPLSDIRYDVIDEAGRLVVRNEQGFVNDQHYDTAVHRFTTNRFTCYDIDLTPGTNTIVLRCSDLAGNTLVTNLVFVFTDTCII